VPAFIGNLSATEILVIGIVAVLIFGKRLPEVASQTYGQIRRLRQGLDQFRRETGIDREFHSIERTLHDVQHEITTEPKSIPSVPPIRYGAADAVALPAPTLQPLPPPVPPPSDPARDALPPADPVHPAQDPAPGS